MLISLHLPKTAGTSFKDSISKYYKEKGSLIIHSKDIPINTPRFRRNTHALGTCIINALRDQPKAQCIHGHFLPLKYLSYRDAKFVTWLRDPIERIGSHYHYWRRHYCSQRTTAPLQRRVVEENWSLEKFCLSPEIRNLYHQFLWGFPVRRFNFIGITEYYESEMKYFSKNFFGLELPIFEGNKNPYKTRDSYIEDPELLQKITEYHKKDIELYRWALRARENRSTDTS